MALAPDKDTSGTPSSAVSPEPPKPEPGRVAAPKPPPPADDTPRLHPVSPEPRKPEPGR